MTRQNGRDGVRKEEDLVRLKFAASTAEEAARWLRNSLARVRTGHDLEGELKNAERALQAALERIGDGSEQATSEADLHVLGAPRAAEGEFSGD